MVNGMWQALNTWLYGGSSLVSFGCDIAVLVVIATVVRRHRPDAYSGLQTWAIVSLVGFVFMNIARVVGPMMASHRDGLESFYKMNAALTVVGTLLHLTLVLLLIRGLTALAQPPKPPVIEGQPPYR